MATSSASRWLKCLFVSARRESRMAIITPMKAVPMKYHLIGEPPGDGSEAVSFAKIGVALAAIIKTANTSEMLILKGSDPFRPQGLPAEI